MKKYFLSLFCLLLVGGTLLSCKSNSVPLQTTKTVTIKETVHDTVFKIEKDNSYYQALLECQNGKVIIKTKSEKPSKNGKLEPPVVNVTDNKLTVDCNLKEQELYAKWKSQQIKEIVEVPVPVEKKLSNWQSFQIWCGRLFLLLFALFCLGVYLKLKKVI